MIFSVAGHDVQRPTHPRLHVRDARDAQMMFEACRLGILKPVSRRLNDSERAMFIKSGSVFIWQEADDDIGLKRWTDGLMWSCSRMREPFLFYEEKTLGDQLDPKSRKDLAGTKHAKELPSTGLLVKQTYSAIVTLPGSPPDAKRRKWHITCYFTHEDFPHLPTLDMIPVLKSVKVPPGVYRSGKSRQSARSNGDFGYADDSSSRRTSASPTSSPIIPNTPTTYGSSRSSSATSSPLVAHSGIQWASERYPHGSQGYPLDGRSYDTHVVDAGMLELPAIRPAGGSPVGLSDTCFLRSPHDPTSSYDPRLPEDERMIPSKKQALSENSIGVISATIGVPSRWGDRIWDMECIKITKVDRVVLVKGGVQQEGTLHLTAHHLIFHKNEEQETWIPYPLISLVTRLPQTLTGTSPISVRCRTFENITLYFKNSQDALDVFDSIKESTVATSVTKLYAFYYQPPADTPRKGWAAFTPREEFARMGVGSRTKAWRFTDFNKDYRVCPTYPAILVVPARISDATLKYAAEYRSKARIPSLSYLHWGNFATITRCSQPMVGLTGNRSVQDEKLIEAIFQSHHSAHSVYAGPPDGRSRSTSSPVYGATTVNLIIDARPMTNAMANAAKGAGTENMDNYKEAKKVYLGIDNIHVMRDSLAKVTEALYEADMLAGMSASNSELPDISEPAAPKTFLDRQLLRRSGWLRHLSAILEGTVIIVDNVHVKASHSLLHCSDGWDRTAQLSSLAQICLDPFFRTIRGFYVIVEKEWLSYGHKFLDRCGHLSSEKLFVTAPNDGGGSGSDAAQAFFASVQNKFSSQSHLKETSPVFHQFLESLWQILRQFPTRFEYNEEFLLKVHYHLNSCQFGTFLFNCERERRVSDGDQPTAEQRTHSIWDWCDTQRSSWLNPDFDPESNDSTNRDMGVLIPDPKDVRFWYRLYGRGDEDMNGGGIANQATAAGVELRGPISGPDDDPVLQLAGSPLLALTPSSTPPPSGDPDSSKAALRLPYQAWSPARPKRTTPGPPSTSSSPAPGVSRQDSFRPFGSTTSAFSIQPGANEVNAPVSSRPWGNAGGFAGGAGGMKSVWASLSSNASAVFQAAQQAYDNTTREYSSPSAESSSTRHNDLLSAGGELPTVSSPGSLGRRAGSTSLARGPLNPVELGNPWSDEPASTLSSSATQPVIISPTPVETTNSKSTIDLGTQPWAQPSVSSPQPRAARPPSLPDSIGSLPSLSDLTLLTESSMSRSRSSAVPSPKPPPPTTDTAPPNGGIDNRQSQSMASDIDPLGVGFK